eukprot:m.336119 g.336119  ORF g.336119 m.336119 type:complete len:411 (-) comp17764_c0_seq1:253-1485(-)
MADNSGEPLYDQTPGAYMHVEPDEIIPEHLDNPVYFLQQNGNNDATGYMAVEPDWLSEQWDLLSDQPWFRGFQNRDESERELRSCAPGGFVVRVSVSEPGHYAISCVQHGMDFDHMLILPSRAGGGGVAAPGNTRYRLGTYSRHLFNTVPKLIAYYIDHPYVDDRRLQGYVRPEQQPGGYMEINPSAPSWLRGEIGREKAEDILRGGSPGSFILRTKRGQGNVLSVAQPPGHPKAVKHHLIKADNGVFTIDNKNCGRHRDIGQLISLLQSDTLGILSCPLQISDFDDPTFDFDGDGGYDPSTTVHPAGEDPLYDSAADGYHTGQYRSGAEDPYSDVPLAEELESYRDIAPNPEAGDQQFQEEVGYGDLPGAGYQDVPAADATGYQDVPASTDNLYGDTGEPMYDLSTMPS